MKKLLIALLAIVILLSCVACGDQKPAQNADTTSNTPANDTTAPTPGTTQPSGSGDPGADAEVSGSAHDGIDIDLTQLSSTVVYSEVYNMISTPADYYGKVIRMKGQFNASYYEPTDNYYYYVIISDATACCAQGIEFVWEGDHSYPEDYPENGTEVEVTGVYGTYEEEGVTYNYVKTEDVKLIGA